MSSSEEIRLIATLYPAPCKSERLLELFEGVFKNALADEPDLLKYHLHQKANTPSSAEGLIMLETYKDKQALAEHRNTPHYKAFSAVVAKERLMAKAPHVKFIRPVGGFASGL